MKTMIAMGTAGIFLFAISAATSHFMFGGNVDTPEPAPTIGEMMAEMRVENSATKPDEAAAPNNDSLAVSFRPDQPVAVETVLQLSEAIRKREKQLNDREQAVIREEQRIKQMSQDLAREQQELAAFAESVDARIQTARELLETIKTVRAEALADKQEADKIQKRLSSDGTPAKDDIDNQIDQVKGWFRSLEAGTAATYLKHFANQGDIEFAARLLRNIDDKQAAKILAELNDPTLGASLVDALRANK